MSSCVVEADTILISWHVSLKENETRSTWEQIRLLIDRRFTTALCFLHTVHMKNLQESFSTAQRSEEQFCGEADFSANSTQTGARPRKGRSLILHTCNYGKYVIYVSRQTTKTTASVSEDFSTWNVLHVCAVHRNVIERLTTKQQDDKYCQNSYPVGDHPCV